MKSLRPRRVTVERRVTASPLPASGGGLMRLTGRPGEALPGSRSTPQWHHVARAASRRRNPSGANITGPSRQFKSSTATAEEAPPASRGTPLPEGYLNGRHSTCSCCLANWHPALATRPKPSLLLTRPQLDVLIFPLMRDCDFWYPCSAPFMCPSQHKRRSTKWARSRRIHENIYSADVLSPSTPQERGSNSVSY